MKSLFIISSATGYGGAERSVELLVGELQKTLRLTIFAEHPLHIDRLLPVLRPPSELVRLPSNEDPARRRASVVRLVWHLWTRRPDAVLANTEASALLMADAAKWAGGPPVFVYVRDFLWRQRAYIFKRLPGAHVLIPSPALLEREGYLCDDVRPRGRLPWSVVPDMTPLVADDSRAASAQPCVLHLATVNRFKGHVHLIRAARLLKERGNELRVESYGVSDGPLQRAELERLVAELDLAGRFALRPYVAYPDDLLRDCLCVVVVSVSHSGGPETFGRTIIEAWAHGKPVVAFAAGSVPHLIEHEVDGLLVPEGDEAALADALWRIKADPELRKRLGENGRSKTRRHFETGRVARKLVAVLEGSSPAEEPWVTSRTGA